MNSRVQRPRANSSSLTRLMLASATGQAQVVQTLLASGEDANVRGPRGSTALMFAAGAGHLDVVQELLAHGADADLQEDGGWNALRHAEEDGSEEVASFLRMVERGRKASPNTKPRK